MAWGKETCKILKEIRRQIAEANDIEFITSECKYKGDCLGTCPKCEAEVRYLEQQLRARRLAGKAVALAGISAGTLAMLMPMTADAQNETQNITKDSIAVESRIDSTIIKGTVSDRYTEPNGNTGTNPLIGATIENLNSKIGTGSDIDGNFEIAACIGDSIKVSYIGYKSKTVVITDISQPITVVLDEDASMLPGEMVVAGMLPTVRHEITHSLELNVIDEEGNRIDINDLDVERIWIDENGEEDYDWVPLHYHWWDKSYQIYWDADLIDNDTDKPLKKATLRITAEGYDDPVIIKVKYPKHHAKKTIRFKHKK